MTARRILFVCTGNICRSPTADHLEWLRRACPTAQRSKVGLFLDFSEEFAGGEVPDPYYGNAAEFERVLDLVEHAAERMLRKLAGP